MEGDHPKASAKIFPSTQGRVILQDSDTIHVFKGASSDEKKTIEGTERTALDEGCRKRMPVIEEF
jgi:hypothetical protein